MQNEKEDQHLHAPTLDPAGIPGNETERTRKQAGKLEFTSAERIKLRPIFNRSSRKADVQPLESIFPLRRHCYKHTK